MPDLNTLNNKVTWLRVSIILLSVLYGVLHHYDALPHGVNEGILILLLFFLMEQFLGISNKLHDGDKKDNEQKRFVEAERNINGHLLKNLMEELNHSIKIDGSNLIIKHFIWALYSYTNYWSLLVEQQKNSQGEVALELQIIHSCEMGVWIDHPLTQRFLQEQRKFCEYGGKITRILCSRGAVPKDKIKAAAKQMMDIGIKVRYFDIASFDVNHSFSWDFLRTVQNENCVIWSAFGPGIGGPIELAVYTKTSEYEGTDLKRLWSDIEKHSVEFTEGPSINIG
ncbi:MAG TPA: hypothetical protein VGO50_02000 [Pyrinomonadaceae bacterium]|jgi:hypothetical protein|nr:hypothetical protein [Pyrinomonadaceae bacterium]